MVWAGRGGAGWAGRGGAGRTVLGLATAPRLSESPSRLSINKGSSFVDADDTDDPPLYYSLYCFAPRNPLRLACKRLVSHSSFDLIIMVAICLSSVCLAFDSPRLDPDSNLAFWLDWLNVVWTVRMPRSTATLAVQ